MIKVKEIKQDAILDIKVNKAYYIMVKECLVSIYGKLNPDKETVEKIAKGSEHYDKLSSEERSIYIMSLLISEIERQAELTGNYDDREILEPGDEGYIEPKN
jgi:hypothetical protein